MSRLIFQPSNSTLDLELIRFDKLIYISLLLRPAHSKLFFPCVGWGVIVTWVGHLGVFVFLYWPDMVPNQRQLFIIKDHIQVAIPHLCLWDLDYV